MAQDSFNVGEMSKRLTAFAKNLRKNSTDAERLLWSKLRSKQIEGLKFRRQQPIRDIIVDFVSFEKRVVVELDGGQHAEQGRRDFQRDDFLERHGFKVLRFWNNEILEHLDDVLEVIRKECLR